MQWLIDFFAKNRWELYGISSVVGLLIALVCEFMPRIPQAEVKLSAVVVERTADLEERQRTISEVSAGEISKLSKKAGIIASSDKVLNDLFQGKWIRPPGWSGTIVSLPERSPSGDWEVDLKEDWTSTKFSMQSMSGDMARLRIGDRVAVSSGQIFSVSHDFDDGAHVILNNISFETLSQISWVSQCWIQYRGDTIRLLTFVLPVAVFSTVISLSISGLVLRMVGLSPRRKGRKSIESI